MLYFKEKTKNGTLFFYCLLFFYIIKYTLIEYKESEREKEQEQNDVTIELNKS